MGTGGPPGRIECRQQGDHKGGEADEEDVLQLRIGGQLTDVVDAGIEKVDLELPFDPADYRLDIVGQQHAAQHAQNIAGDPQRGPLHDEDPHDAAG